MANTEARIDVVVKGGSKLERLIKDVSRLESVVDRINVTPLDINVSKAESGFNEALRQLTEAGKKVKNAQKEYNEYDKTIKKLEKSYLSAEQASLKAIASEKKNARERGDAIAKALQAEGELNKAKKEQVRLQEVLEKKERGFAQSLKYKEEAKNLAKVVSALSDLSGEYLKLGKFQTRTPVTGKVAATQTRGTIAQLNAQAEALSLVAANSEIATRQFNQFTIASEIASQNVLSARQKQLRALAMGLTAPTKEEAVSAARNVGSKKQLAGARALIGETVASYGGIVKSEAALSSYINQLRSLQSIVPFDTSEWGLLETSINEVNAELEQLQARYAGLRGQSSDIAQAMAAGIARPQGEAMLLPQFSVKSAAEKARYERDLANKQDAQVDKLIALQDKLEGEYLDQNEAIEIRNKFEKISSDTAEGLIDSARRQTVELKRQINAIKDRNKALQDETEAAVSLGRQKLKEESKTEVTTEKIDNARKKLESAAKRIEISAESELINEVQKKNLLLQLDEARLEIDQKRLTVAQTIVAETDRQRRLEEIGNRAKFVRSRGSSFAADPIEGPLKLRQKYASDVNEEYQKQLDLADRISKSDLELAKKENLSIRAAQALEALMENRLEIAQEITKEVNRQLKLEQKQVKPTEQVFGALGTGYLPISGRMPSGQIVPGSPADAFRQTKAKLSWQIALAQMSAIASDLEESAKAKRAGIQMNWNLAFEKAKDIVSDATLAGLQDGTKAAVSLGKQQLREIERSTAKMWRQFGGPALPPGFGVRGGTTRGGETLPIDTPRRVKNTLASGAIVEQGLINLQAKGVDVTEQLISLQKTLNDAKRDDFQISQKTLGNLEEQVTLAGKRVTLENRRLAGKRGGAGDSGVTGFSAALTDAEARKQIDQIYKDFNKAVAENVAVGSGADVGENIAEGIARGAVESSSIKSGAKTFAQRLIAAYKATFRIKSPSKETEQKIGIPLGLGIIRGLLSALRSGKKEVQQEIESIAKPLIPKSRQPRRLIGTVQDTIAVTTGPSRARATRARAATAGYRPLQSNVRLDSEIERMFNQFRVNIAAVTTDAEIYYNLLQSLPSSRITTDLADLASRRARAAEVPGFMAAQRQIGPGDLERAIASSVAESLKGIRAPDPWVGVTGDYNKFIDSIVKKTQELIRLHEYLDKFTVSSKNLLTGTRIAGALPPSRMGYAADPGRVERISRLGDVRALPPAQRRFGELARPDIAMFEPEGTAREYQKMARLLAEASSDLAAAKRSIKDVGFQNLPVEVTGLRGAALTSALLGYSQQARGLPSADLSTVRGIFPGTAPGFRGGIQSGVFDFGGQKTLPPIGSQLALLSAEMRKFNRDIEFDLRELKAKMRGGSEGEHFMGSSGGGRYTAGSIGAGGGGGGGGGGGAVGGGAAGDGGGRRNRGWIDDLRDDIEEAFRGGDLPAITRATSNQLEDLAESLQRVRRTAGPASDAFRVAGRGLRAVAAEQERRDPSADFLTRRFGARRGRAIGEGVIGGAFPLLFGQGVGASVGGGAGGFFGSLIGGNLGFGLSLLGTALGDVFDQLQMKAAAIGNALQNATSNMEALRESGVNVTAELEAQVRLLNRYGASEAAQSAVEEAVFRQTGDIGGQSTRLAAGSANELQKAFEGMSAAAATAVGIIGAPFMQAIAAAFRGVQLILFAFNSIVTAITTIVNAIPGMKALGDALYEASLRGTAEYEKRQNELEKETENLSRLLQEQQKYNSELQAASSLRGTELKVAKMLIDYRQKERQAVEAILQKQEELGAGRTVEERKRIETKLNTFKQLEYEKLKQFALQNENEILDAQEDNVKKIQELNESNAKSYRDMRLQIERQIEDERIAATRRIEDAELKGARAVLDFKEKGLQIIQNQRREQIELASAIRGLEAQFSDNPSREGLAAQLSAAVDQYKNGLAEADENRKLAEEKIQLDAREAALAIERFKQDNARRVARINEESVRKIAEINEKIDKQRNESYKYAYDLTIQRLIAREQAAANQLEQQKAGNKALLSHPFITPDYKIEIEQEVRSIDAQLAAVETGMQRLRTLQSQLPATPQLQNVGSLPAMTSQANEVSAAETRVNSLIQAGRERLLQLEQQNTKESAAAGLARQNLQIIGSEASTQAQITDSLNKRIEDAQRYKQLLASGINPELAKQIAAIEGASAKISDVIQMTIEQLEAVDASRFKELIETLRGIQKDQPTIVSGQIDKAKKALELEKPTLAEGISAEITQLKKDLDPITVATNSIVNGANAIGTAFGQAFTDVASGAKSTEEALADTFESIGKAFLGMAAEIIAKQLTMIALQTTLKVLGAISGGGGGFGSAPLGEGFTTGASASSFDAVGAGIFTPKANGGPVNANQPYIVGERGPELFVPSSSGMVLSNSATREKLEQQDAVMSDNATREKLEQQDAVMSGNEATREKLEQQDAVMSDNATRSKLEQQDAVMSDNATRSKLEQQDAVMRSNEATREQLEQQDAVLRGNEVTRQQLIKQQNTVMRSNEATRQQLIKQQNTMTTNRIREVERTSLAMMASPDPIDVRYESSVINNVEYVTAEQHRQGMAQAAERGRALTLQALQNSVKSRRKVGLA